MYKHGRAWINTYCSHNSNEEAPSTLAHWGCHYQTTKTLLTMGRAKTSENMKVLLYIAHSQISLS